LFCYIFILGIGARLLAPTICLIFQDASFGYYNPSSGLSGTAAIHFNEFDNVIPIQHHTKHYMATVQPWRAFHGDKELTSICIGACIGHGQDKGSSVLELKVFVLKFVPIDGKSTGSIVIGKITSL
jgi:hypothetical protein